MTDDQKLPPYQRLKILINDETELTEKGSKNLDILLGTEEKKPTIFDKIKRFFIKIDTIIFVKKSKITNKYHKRK